jgi:hypothetical protein
MDAEKPILSTRLNPNLAIEDKFSKIFVRLLIRGLPWFVLFPGFLESIDADKTDGGFITVAGHFDDVTVDDSGAHIKTGN